MAVGGFIGNIESVTTGGTMDIRSTSGVTWLIQNITWGGPVTVARASTALTGTFLTDTEAGALLSTMFRVSESVFIRITNTSTAANVCGYDGIIWSE